MLFTCFYIECLLFNRCAFSRAYDYTSTHHRIGTAMISQHLLLLKLLEELCSRHRGGVIAAIEDDEQQRNLRFPF